MTTWPFALIQRWHRMRQLTCEHDWHYDTEESKGPWTGYIERCSKCGGLQQIPQ